jgi:hypothetical protein
MSMARAIAEATGLDPSKDFEVRNEGAGPFLYAWRSQSVPRPTAAQIAEYIAAYADILPKRQAEVALREFAIEYLIAFIVNREFGDNTRMARVQAKINAWKAAHPGIVP